MSRFHLHDMRHSAASETINSDVALHIGDAVLGRKDERSMAHTPV